jgi:hypothetical protein
MSKIIAPGTPNIPTTIQVIKLIAICKPNIPPIKLIAKINMPPKIELNTNFKINFIGIINILPNKNKKHIHAKKVNIFISICIPLFFNEIVFKLLRHFEKIILF